MKTITRHEALLLARQALRDCSDSVDVDAQCLVLKACQTNKTALFTYPEQTLNEQQHSQLQEMIERRQKGEPIAYIIGHQEFWSMDFFVTPDVLIPRPATEAIIEFVLNLFQEQSAAFYVADLGMGSGAIACAVAKERPQWKIHATDISKAAITIAEKNITQHQLKNIACFHGSWCEALPRRDYGLIISNPPYICDNDQHLQALKFEPKAALTSGKDGLDDIRIIIQQAPSYLRENGVLIIEHGFDQQEAVLDLLNKAGFKSITGYDDLAKQPRFVSANL